jgi:CDP-6-deoxy-D-xylo-4-hexulose-3-dehydrase
MKKIKLASDTISDSDYKILIKFLQKRSYLNQSRITKKFEMKFSKIIGKKYSIFVNSGSSANLLIAQTLLEGKNLKNKTVVVPSVSWSTTVSPFVQLGYNVVICDSNSSNLGLNIQHLTKICKKYNPGLVVAVNVLGHPNDYNKIQYLKKRFNFYLVEDNCESLGSKYKNKSLGSIGFASSHSFYFGHHISTIEGGMVCTDDYKFYNIALSIRSHGWARDLQKKIKNKLEKKYNITPFESFYKFYYQGFNLRSTDFNATLGINQLKKLNFISKIRYKNYLTYKKLLSNFWFQKSDSKLISSFGYSTFVKNRDEVYEILVKNNIESRPIICGNIARQPFMKEKYLNIKDSFNNANFTDKYGIYLPNHANLSTQDIELVTKKFLKLAKPIFFKK